MNVLFLTVTPIVNLKTPSVHIGILRQFRDEGHNVYIVSPYEKRVKKETDLVESEGIHFLHVKTGNITQCGMIERGITTLTINRDYKRAIYNNLKDVVFDLILYSTPPITFCDVIEQIKIKDKAKTYLMLKDIFPQNAVDIGVLRNEGINKIIYSYFRGKEKKLYALSDIIGCMSPENVNYIINHNTGIDRHKVCLCPNSADEEDKSVSTAMIAELRQKYEIPLDRKVFVYGGNLGRPQGVPYLIKCLKECKDNDKIFFLIVGDGTEFGRLKEYHSETKQSNLKILKRLPKKDYDNLVASCDVGMIFLNYNFTIPNYPSRLLPYLQAKVPVLAVTDPNTDVGKIAIENGYGWWCESNNPQKFLAQINKIINADTKKAGENGYVFFLKNYTSKIVYQQMKQQLREITGMTM